VDKKAAAANNNSKIIHQINATGHTLVYLGIGFRNWTIQFEKLVGMKEG